MLVTSISVVVVVVLVVVVVVVVVGLGLVFEGMLYLTHAREAICRFRSSTRRSKKTKNYGREEQSVIEYTGCVLSPSKPSNA